MCARGGTRAFGDLTSAMEFWEYYEKDFIPQKRRKRWSFKKEKTKQTVPKDTPRSKMYGALIDECCRLNDVSSALSVFDKAKDGEVGLNTVTLAFLESCCRRSKVDEWRVFDVCAQMRIQSEQRKSMKNPQVHWPLYSHHVAGDLEYESSSDKESAIESALEKRSVAPKSGNKRKNGNRERTKYKSHEEMLCL